MLSRADELEVEEVFSLTEHLTVSYGLRTVRELHGCFHKDVFGWQIGKQVLAAGEHLSVPETSVLDVDG